MAGKDEKKPTGGPAKPKRITKAESEVAPRERRTRIKEEGVLPKPRVRANNGDLSDTDAKSFSSEKEGKQGWKRPERKVLNKREGKSGDHNSRPAGDPVKSRDEKPGRFFSRDDKTGNRGREKDAGFKKTVKRTEKAGNFSSRETNPLLDPGRNADYDLKPEKGSGYKRPERRNIRKEGLSPGKQYGKPERFTEASENEGGFRAPSKPLRQKETGERDRPPGKRSGRDDGGKFSSGGEKKISRKETFAARRSSEQEEVGKLRGSKPVKARERFSKDAESAAVNKPKGRSSGQDWEKPFKSPEFISGNKSKTFRPKKAHQPTLEEQDGKIRLNKYISNAGICSRRGADQLIASGAVKVNGKIVTELGTRISITDKVQYGDQTLNKETKRYLLLNKPKDYITTASDPEGRKTVMELVKNACRERLYPVGRLDRATTGLLLMTNDGDLAKKLTHPSHQVKKIYHVSLDKSLKAVDMKKILEGLLLEDGKAEVDEIAYVGEGKDKSEIGVALHSGKNRIVRRIFEHLGYEVVKLDRTYFAGLTKKDLPRGKFRFLSEKEVIMLRMS